MSQNPFYIFSNGYVPWFGVTFWPAIVYEMVITYQMMMSVYEMIKEITWNEDIKSRAERYNITECRNLYDLMGFHAREEMRENSRKECEKKETQIHLMILFFIKTDMPSHDPRVSVSHHQIIFSVPYISNRTEWGHVMLQFNDSYWKTGWKERNRRKHSPPNWEGV